MYVRSLRGRELNFGVSGLLWEGSLVMIDDETESLWSHLLGESMRGPMQGEQLEVIPALMTDWKTWKSRHPKTTVAILSRTAERYRRGIVANDMSYGICLSSGEHSKSWPLPLDARSPEEEALRSPVATRAVVNDELDGRPLLVYWDGESETAAVYDRRVEEQQLTFQLKDKLLVDQETSSEWDPVLGVATSGPLKGQRLARQPAMLSEMGAWITFHPSTMVWKDPRPTD